MYFSPFAKQKQSLSKISKLAETSALNKRYWMIRSAQCMFKIYGPFLITCPATGGRVFCRWMKMYLASSSFIWCLIKLVAACPATSVFYVWAECRRIWQKLITPTNPFDGPDHTLSDRGVFHQIGVVMLASPCKKANNQIEKNKISEGTKQEMLKIKMMIDCMSC